MKIWSILICLSSVLWALKGRVIDENGVGVPGVSLTLKTQGSQAVSQSDGAFEFDLSSSFFQLSPTNSFEITSTSISLSLNSPSRIQMNWFNTLGQEIYKINEELNAGDH